MVKRNGPFQVIDEESSLAPIEPPKRRYSCPNYETCLNLAASLNWDNFSCRGCSGEVDDHLIWRAKQAHRKDSVAKSLCKIPDRVETIFSKEEECARFSNLGLDSLRVEQELSLAKTNAADLDSESPFIGSYPETDFVNKLISHCILKKELKNS
jgi:hypothetical protein